MGFGGLYTSMAGLETATQRLDTAAENLANVNTQGYAAAQTEAMSLSYTGQRALPGADVISLGEQADIAQGPMLRTGGAFDVAVKGGWLVVQGPGGTPALTRAGRLAINENGLLVTANGNPVLGTDGNPISLPALKSLTVSSSGQVSGVADTSASTTPQVFARLLLAQTPAAGVTPIGNSLYALPPGVAPVLAAQASVRQGYLEGSNVDPVQAMMSLISISKDFQLQTQVVTASAKDSSQLDQVLLA